MIAGEFFSAISPRRMGSGMRKTVKPILEKPLGQLTEENISQLTREDCRRFLKEKGMRRPSWNKSQAIQQVLSFKALFEPGDDSGAAFSRRILASPPENVPRVKSVSSESFKALEGSAQILSAPCHENPRRSAEFVGQFAAEKEDNTIMPLRSPAETNGSVGQMTIFYCGNVNVYDRIPTEKALAIIRFAASPTNSPQNDSSRRQMETHKCALGPSSDRMVELPQEIGNNARDQGTDVEVQANRKVSLQRYLEKRKDRGRFFKRGKGLGAPSSSLEMYLNHQTRRIVTSYGQSSRSSTTSPPNFDSFSRQSVQTCSSIYLSKR